MKMTCIPFIRESATNVQANAKHPITFEKRKRYRDENNDLVIDL